ncbi:replication-associated recombination protein A [Heliorestis acidaminivorans]|uniref:Replication-associated recombination protein A n=1 Tax=Heliorestis acidaminivorans TaxID=553427 RepID=A0A6I0ERN1_9FIRM|nr:replication-associated recombination protein A [Heliorestis acidaminivorans]KAB2952303.1 replication-associated recombination protein A [Heliorestis acidaminivorans]
MDLFSYQREEHKNIEGPLAYRMRPRDLDEVVGQAHLVGPKSSLRKMIEEDKLHSFILYGPPGTGKTTLARLIAHSTKSYFVTLSAVSSNSAEIKKTIQEASERLGYYQERTILFVDEIHRFNKAQQDLLLPAIEDGTLILIGATTENPLYEVNAALISRLRVYMLYPLSEADMRRLLLKALTDTERGLGLSEEKLTEEALELIVRAAKGDGRAALTLLDMVMTVHDKTEKITAQHIMEITGKMATYYDKKGSGHYDTISAYIKSIRGSDPDAALFWLALMLEAGEDPLYIARRLIIHAAEDIGLADPMALVLAQSTAEAVKMVGLPEGQIPLSQATIYLACAPKSNSAKVAIYEARAAVRESKGFQIPRHLADTSHALASQVLQSGQGYHYPHDYGGYIKQSYLPAELEGRRFYKPTEQGREKSIKQWLQELEKHLQKDSSNSD